MNRTIERQVMCAILDVQGRHGRMVTDLFRNVFRATGAVIEKTIKLFAENGIVGLLAPLKRKSGEREQR